jgi:regulatory protein
MPESILFKTAVQKAMDLCSRRELCKYEIRGKIASWGVPAEDTEKIIEVLIKEKFIDEERYALAFTRDKFNYNKWGKLKIMAHLRAKEIPGELITKAQEAIDNDLYLKILKNLISDHRRFVKARNQYDLKAKLMRFGLSRGFESSLLYDLLNDMEE